jgi:osmotically-inducible protein OsmY
MKIESDAQLQRTVLQEFEWDPSIDSSKIGVAAGDGVVTLSGFVPSYADKMAAERVAKRVYGVRAVVNNIDVKLIGARQTDTDIAAAAVSALKWDSNVVEDHFKLTVSNGWVTLEGETEWWFQKDAAERAIHNLSGVKGITNNITIKAKAKPESIKNSIEAALQRSAELDARRISVEVRERKVILKGNVRSWAERDAAQQLAWSAPGVAAVENEIQVTP